MDNRLIQKFLYGSRRAIGLTAVITAVTSLGGCTQHEHIENSIENNGLGFRPNILWITCEDINPALGCYGDSNAYTPNLDKFASEGVRFTNAFSTAGVCSPSRHAIITGMYQTSTGGQHMRTTSCLAPGVPDYGVVTEPEVKCFSEFLRAQGYYCTNNVKTDYQFDSPRTAWDDCSVEAHWRNRKKGQNFFSVFNFMTTHESRIWMQSDEPLLVDINQIKVPPYFPDNPIIKRDVARKYSNITEMDAQFQIILDQLEADGLLDSTIVFFFSDHGGMLPREKRELYETGIHVPFLVRFPKALDAGKVNDELISFVDLAPTMLSLAGISIPDYMQGQAFLGNQKAREERKYIYAARDRMDSEYDMVRAVRDKHYKYLSNYRPELPYVQNIAYRKNMPIMNVLYQYDRENKFEGVQKLWWRKTKPHEELYDLKDDPFEFNNLAENSEYQEKLKEMRGALKQWQEKYGDKGFIDEKEMIRQMWQGETQPLTEPVEFTIDGNRLSMSSKTEGASIAWQYANAENMRQWNLYTGSVKVEKGESVRAQAFRIGYQPSDVKTENFKE